VYRSVAYREKVVGVFVRFFRAASPTENKCRRIVKGRGEHPPITFDMAERTDMVSHAEVPVLEN
jgi:hypothetical protein